MKLARFALLPAAVLALGAVPASATGVAVGATVYGPQGGEVGTIEQIDGNAVIVNTGKHKVTLGQEAFGEGTNGPTITVTKADLDAALDQQAAEAAMKLDAALVAGNPVVSAKGEPLGTIESVDGETVVLAREGRQVALKREHFGLSEAGLMAYFTIDQVEQAIGGQ